MAVAREAQTALLFDAMGRLLIVDAAGETLAETVLTETPVAADLSDDGRIAVVATRNGRLLWFDRQLQRRRIDTLDAAPAVVALDVDGSHAAVATGEGPMLVLDCYGQTLFKIRSARLVDRLLFLDERPALLAMSEQGHLAWYESDGRVRYASHLAMRLSDIAADERGDLVLVAAPALGLMRVDARGEPTAMTSMRVEAPAELAIAADGAGLLVATLANELVLMTAAGTRVWQETLPGRPARVAMDPLAGRAWCLLEDGRVLSMPLGD